LSAVAVPALLGVAVAAAWLAALGFVRLERALDRLHCATFVNTVAGPALALAVIFQEGATSRAWITAALVVAACAIGAAASHALGRALVLRDGEGA